MFMKTIIQRDMEILFEDIKVLLETWRLHRRDIETSNAINKIHGDFLERQFWFIHWKVSGNISRDTLNSSFYLIRVAFHSLKIIRGEALIIINLSIFFYRAWQFLISSLLLLWKKKKLGFLIYTPLFIENGCFSASTHIMIQYHLITDESLSIPTPPMW